MHCDEAATVLDDVSVLASDPFVFHDSSPLPVVVEDPLQLFCGELFSGEEFVSDLRRAADPLV